MAANPNSSESSRRRIAIGGAALGLGGSVSERVSRILGNGMLRRSTVPCPAGEAISRAGASVPSTGHSHITDTHDAVEGSSQEQPMSAEEELRLRFPSLQQTRGTVGSSRRRLTPYLPRHNYTPTSRRQRSSMIQIASRSSSRRACNPIMQSQLFTRDVVLVEAGEDVPVPRGKYKQELHDRGCIINMMEIDKQWNESRLFDKIERRLPKLDTSKPFPR